MTEDTHGPTPIVGLLPRRLVAVPGPLRPERVDGAVKSLGVWGEGSAALAAAGFVPPDVLVGQTLFLLAGQPRTARDDEEGRASPIAGGVWVREQATFLRPMKRDEGFTVVGAAARRYVRKGRTYSVTSSDTIAPNGRLIVSNCSVGLVAYQPDPNRPDSEEGQAEADMRIPQPDWDAAVNNPCVGALRNTQSGESFAGDPVEITLALMQLRDGSQPRNPIHSDPEQARRAGLPAPIAGGSHVLAFGLELLMKRWGAEVLLHGASIDVRWLTPTFAETTVYPTATLVAATSDGITVVLEINGEAGLALRATVTIPLASQR